MPAYTVAVGPPEISSISRASVPAGASGFFLRITGSGFTGQSVVDWDGSARQTTYVSPTELTAQIGSLDVSTASDAAVQVSTPGDTFGAISTPGTFVITGLSPTSVTTGGAGFTLTVLGQGFTTSSTVQWNATARTTTYVSSTEALAQIQAADIASAGTASVTVQTAGSRSWSSGNVTILPPSKDAVAVQINPEHSGAIELNVTLPVSSSWSTDVGGTPSYALIADGKVSVTVSEGGDSALVALDEATGAVVWGPIAISGDADAAYDAGTVFVVSAASVGAPQVQAYDAATTGTAKWNSVLARGGEYGFVGPPTAANGFVFQTTNVTQYALSESSGDVPWAGGDGFRSLAVTLNGVYLAPVCSTLDTRPATAANIWFTDGGCSAGGGGSTPVVSGGVVYARSRTALER